jgi:DNA-binding IclR family transcriptional regulator
VIPDDVRRFVLTSIPSVPYLEAALLFYRASHMERTSTEVAHSLYLPEQKATELLQALCEAGILKMRSGASLYRYEPRDAELAAAIERLSSAYASDIIGVTHLIHDSLQKSAQQFADAFKLRKDR